VGSRNQLPLERWSGRIYIYERLPTYPKEQLLVESYRSILGLHWLSVLPGPLEKLDFSLLLVCRGFHIPKMLQG
jgi:hypothetical protein